MKPTTDTGNGVTESGGLHFCPPKQCEKMIHKTGKVTALPSSVPTGTTDLFIDLDTQGNDFDLTGWLPTGLATGAKIRVRKCDASGGVVKFTDDVRTYDFVETIGEAISFVFDGQAICFDC